MKMTHALLDGLTEQAKAIPRLRMNISSELSGGLVAADTPVSAPRNPAPSSSRAKTVRGCRLLRRIS